MVKGFDADAEAKKAAANGVKILEAVDRDDAKGCEQSIACYYADFQAACERAIAKKSYLALRFLIESTTDGPAARSFPAGAFAAMEEAAKTDDQMAALVAHYRTREQKVIDTICTIFDEVMPDDFKFKPKGLKDNRTVAGRTSKLTH